jgi:hypothetical protein
VLQTSKHHWPVALFSFFFFFFGSIDRKKMQAGVLKSATCTVQQKFSKAAGKPSKWLLLKTLKLSPNINIFSMFTMMEQFQMINSDVSAKNI